MNKKRPMNLDLRTIKLPVMAIASILHRLSGVVLFLLLPLMLWFLNLSLLGPESFADLKLLLAQPLYKLLMWVFLAALTYHILAGIRHLLMDMGIGEELDEGRRSAAWVVGGSVVLTILLGIWLW